MCVRGSICLLMSDQELDDILSEMEFSSTSRVMSDEGPENPKRNVIRDAKALQKIMISEESFTPSGNLMEIYGEESVTLHDASSAKLESQPELRRKSASGTSCKISKNTKFLW